MTAFQRTREAPATSPQRSGQSFFVQTKDQGGMQGTAQTATTPFFKPATTAANQPVSPVAAMPAPLVARPQLQEVYLARRTRGDSSLFVRPATETTLANLSVFLYGNPNADYQLAQLNQQPIDATVQANQLISLEGIGRPLSSWAYYLLNQGPIFATNQSDPATELQKMGVSTVREFITRKAGLDMQLLFDKQTLLGLIGNWFPMSSFMSLPTIEMQVIAILTKWANEKLTTRPLFYINGGEYMDKLLSALADKIVDIGGLFTTQYSSYYDLIFNRFNRKNELNTLRRQYSVIFNDRVPVQEITFGGVLWDQVKSGQTWENIKAYGKGLGKGFVNSFIETVKFIYTAVTDPKEAARQIAAIPGKIKNAWENRDKIWQAMMQAKPEELAEKIGEIFGGIEAGIATSGAFSATGKGVQTVAVGTGRFAPAAQKLVTVGEFIERLIPPIPFLRGKKKPNLPERSVGANAVRQTGEEVAEGTGRSTATAVKSADELTETAEIVGQLGRMNAETVENLLDNPALREALMRNGRAARMLKKCASPCFPPNATPTQIERLESILQRADEAGIPIDEGALKDYLYTRRESLEDAIDAINESFYAQRSRQMLGTAPEPDAHIETPTNTKVTRGQTGQATGGRNLPDLDHTWLNGGVSPIPGQIARKMRGRHFENWDAFRERFWQLVAEDKHLRSSPFLTQKQNPVRIELGKAPFSRSVDATGRGVNAKYQLDHTTPIHIGGDVFDLDHIHVVTPKVHQHLSVTD